MLGLTPSHIIILVLILAIALIFFGPGRMPEIGAAMGKSIREFRDSMSQMKSEVTPPPPPAPAGPPAPPPTASAGEPPALGAQPPAPPPADPTA
jgi:TatA/E family protein of Tat protein translocase